MRDALDFPDRQRPMAGRGDRPRRYRNPVLTRLSDQASEMADTRALIDASAGLDALRRELRLAEADAADASPVPSTLSPEVSAMSLRLFGRTFFTGAAADILAEAESIPMPGPRLVVTANIDHIVILSENAAFRKAYEGAALRTLDGLPLVWMARACGARRAPRITGHDLLDAAFAQARAGDRIYLVASTDKVVERIRARFVARGLDPAAIAAAVPPFGFETDDAFGRHLAERIRAHGTTLLMMGVGAPKSEIWVDRMGEALGDPVVLSVGEALNVAAGLVPRAPVLMQRMGLEWFFRFLHAPRRLFTRYFVRSWRFAGIAARELGPLAWRSNAGSSVRAVSADDGRGAP